MWKKVKIQGGREMKKLLGIVLGCLLIGGVSVSVYAAPPSIPPGYYIHFEDWSVEYLKEKGTQNFIIEPEESFIGVFELSLIHI